MKIFAAILLLLASAYILLLVFARTFSNSLMFRPPARTYVKTPEHFEIDLPDGGKITGVYLKAEGAKYNVFYSHGNGEDIGMVYGILKNFQNRAISAFSYDYVGYGYNREKPTEKKLYESAEAAWRFAKDKLGFKPENTVVVGFSLGSAAACKVAENEPDIRGVMLAGGIACAAMTVLPVNIIPWKILDNVSKVSNFKRPLLILHGTRDIIVAPRNAKANYRAAGCPKRLVLLRGIGHNDIASSPVYWNETVKFVNNPNYEKSSCDIF